MMGGQGDDSYVVDNILDAVIEKPGEGTDTVIASTHYRLAANVENLVLQGDAITPLQGYGNELGNTLTGNDSVNLLNGLGGADMMAGELGNDVYFVDDSNDQVIENPGGGNDAVFSSASIQLSAEVENLVLQGGTDLQGVGNSLNNQLYGNSGNNTLNGGIGADVLLGFTGDNSLDGGTGIDLMIGGEGDDSYFVDNAGDVVVENSGEGRDTVIASAHYALTADVENLVLQGDATTPLQGYGNGLVNILTGSDGVNLLDGRGDADVMAGGLGGDVYFVDDAGDTVIENANEGIDAVFSPSITRSRPTWKPWYCRAPATCSERATSSPTSSSAIPATTCSTAMMAPTCSTGALATIRSSAARTTKSLPYSSPDRRMATRSSTSMVVVHSPRRIP